ncbi:MAG: DUF47 family protein [archaeon]|nr:DUF47 family protein [archaeon]
MGSLYDYLKRETVENALEKSIKHAQIVEECVKQLNIGIEVLLKEKNLDAFQKHFQEVDSLEDKADTLRREILGDISKGGLNPSVRQDLSHLIKRMDNVANCCTGVARRINTISIEFWKQCSNETVEIVLDMMKNTVSCVELLDKMVVDLLGERKILKETARQINRYEHNVDLLNIKLRKSLQETDFNVNYFTSFTAGNVFDIIEGISDSAEEVADYIMILLTSSESL